MSTAIATANLTKRYGSHAAVDSLSLEVGEGEIYGFLGLNGAGKTTTIRMLLGMVRPTAGTASVLGVTVRPGVTDVWRQVGYLVETPHAYPDLTVRQNLEVAAHLHHVTDRAAVGRTMEQLALGRYANQRAGTLSLGNAQRLGLAKALLHSPRLLLLDEPANALDPAGVVEVREMLRDLAASRGVTVFISSHILSEVARLATRIGIIHEGKLIEEVTSAELQRRWQRWLSVDARDRAALRAALAGAGFTFSDDDGGGLRVADERATEAPDEVARLLVQAGVAPTHLCVQQEDLETRFLHLVGAAGGQR